MLPGDPHGITVGPDGIVYVGLATPQTVVAIDPAKGTVLNEVVLDSAEIASTKELLTLRLASDGSRLIIAQGSDESVTILELPDLGIVREIGFEGEMIRDAIPDPKGRYLYILGRTVHVYDFEGKREIRQLHDVDPMAIAVSTDGSRLAVVGGQEFESGRATIVALYDPSTLKLIESQPLQTDRVISAALFAADDRALVTAASDWLGERRLGISSRTTMDLAGSTPRIQLGFGDLVSSQKICLPQESGPQVMAVQGTTIYFAERRCSESAAFTGSNRLVSSRSLYGVEAWAIALDPGGESIFATDRAGTLTRYRLPEKE